MKPGVRQFWLPWVGSAAAAPGAPRGSGSRSAVGPARVGFHDEVRRPGRRGAQEDGLVLGVELHALAEEPALQAMRSRASRGLHRHVPAVDGGHDLYACTPVLPPMSSRYAGLETMALVM